MPIPVFLYAQLSTILHNLVIFIVSHFYLKPSQQNLQIYEFLKMEKSCTEMYIVHL